MKKHFLITAISLLSVLNIEAQYSLMVKGERCPFDTAVAIRIDTYRLESRKMQLADTLIGSLSFQVGTLEAMRDNLNEQLRLSEHKFALKEEEVFMKQATINELLKQMSYRPEKSWWERNHKPVLFIGGVAVGVGGVALLMHIVGN